MEDKYSGIYAELIELIGEENTRILYDRYNGLTISFPKSYYSKSYIRSVVQSESESRKISDIAREVNLSERRVRQILKEEKDKS